MRWILVTAAFAAAVGFSQPADANDTDTAYASALRYFNPALELGDALQLARETLAQADDQHLDARLLVAVIAIESRWRPQAISPAGARGLGQLMPATAAGLGVDPDDPKQNIAGAARQLRALLDRFAQTGDRRYALALAAYNAGTAAVERYRAIPPYPQTQRYVRRVLRLWRRLAGQGRRE